MKPVCLKRTARLRDGGNTGALAESFFNSVTAPEPEAAAKQEQLPQWRISPDQTGPLRVLTWGGIARNTPRWPHRWASLYRGSLYLLEHSDAAEPLESWNIWNGRCVALRTCSRL